MKRSLMSLQRWTLPANNFNVDDRYITHSHQSEILASYYKPPYGYFLGDSLNGVINVGLFYIAAH
jgi:hypothetical protein